MIYWKDKKWFKKFWFTCFIWQIEKYDGLLKYSCKYYSFKLFARYDLEYYELKLFTQEKTSHQSKYVDLIAKVHCKMSKSARGKVFTWRFKFLTIITFIISMFNSWSWPSKRNIETTTIINVGANSNDLISNSLNEIKMF